MYTLHTTCQVSPRSHCSLPRFPLPLFASPYPSSLPLTHLRFPFFWTPTRVSVRCPSGHTGAGMCACGKGQPPPHSAARTPSQAPLGWGRVPPCTGPRQAGLPRCSFPLSRHIQYISPPLARATVQDPGERAFEAVLLLASLPGKGTDKEAGRSARTPAPEVALLLPAPACA